MRACGRIIAPTDVHYSGDTRWVAQGDGTSKYHFNSKDLPPDSYNIFAAWKPHNNRATDTPFSIYDGVSIQATVDVNQQLAPTPGKSVGTINFQLIGSYTISNGTLTVTITDEANGYVIADAILIERAL